MKIGIDIRSTLKKRTGIGKYTLDLISALAEVDRGNNYLLYSRKKILDFKRRLPGLPGANFSHHVDYFKKGPGAILPDVDVFHTSSYDLHRPKTAKYIVTVHDVIIKAYPYGHSEQTIKEVDEGIRRVLDEADILVTDSFNTKADLIKFYNVKEEMIKVICPGINIENAHDAKRKTQDEYILFVGTLEPRKNVDGVIKAFDWLKKEHGIKHKLYIAGMKGWMFEKIFEAYKQARFKKDIVFKGYVNEGQLSKLYQQASVFIYPSFYEGFGFPIIEAFSYGVPVVTSRTSSCGEIAGDSALLVDPSSCKEIGEAILRLINNEKLREELIKRGIVRAKEFTWTRTASEFVKLFAE
ncbi:MAG: glycosyltransferase family 4 protein [Candidatus Omnitrophica bacterium]|nr:glycosyltransferase family 4 protein [Candidatus Omnitrophota bacterium]